MSTIRFRPVDPQPLTPTPGLDKLAVRRATASDAARVRDLARLDCQRVPAAPYLLAELADEVVAALSLPTGAVVADPFRSTAGAVALLRARADQLADTSELAERRARRQRAGSQDGAPDPGYAA